MKKLSIILLSLLITQAGFSQADQLFSGWIRADLVVSKGATDKVKQDSYDVTGTGEKPNVWLESSEGWVKLHFSIKQQSKMESASVFEEAVPIYDQENVLWETGEMHDLNGPSYHFEFRIFSVVPSQVQGKDIRISLYYRWIIHEADSEEKS